MGNVRTVVAVPRALIERVLIGGNHLAMLIGADHPPYSVSHDTALAHYYTPPSRQDSYEAWCCWKTIMELRDAISDGAQADPEPPTFDAPGMPV